MKLTIRGNLPEGRQAQYAIQEVDQILRRLDPNLELITSQKGDYEMPPPQPMSGGHVVAAILAGGLVLTLAMATLKK